MAGNSFFDKAKVLAQDLGTKAKDAAVQNSDKLDDAVTKAADFADKRTKGKYRDKITKAESAAKRAVTKLEAEKAREARRRPVTDPPVVDPDPGMARPTSAAQPTAADPEPPVATPEPPPATPRPPAGGTDPERPVNPT
jgi:hypothetical protein